MAITNGYATLAEVKDRLFDSKTYRTTTITFTSTGSLINDPAGGLGKFDAGETISITTASGSNTGNYAIITGNSNTQLTLGSAVVTLTSGSLTTVTTALADDNALAPIPTATFIQLQAARRDISPPLKRIIWIAGTSSASPR
jgi:hypothetical protein